MEEMMEVISLLLVVLVGCAVIVWLLIVVHKSVGWQKKAMDVQREAMDRHKVAMAHVEEGLAISKQQTENQKRIISLLEEINSKMRS